MNNHIKFEIFTNNPNVKSHLTNSNVNVFPLTTNIFQTLLTNRMFVNGWLLRSIYYEYLFNNVDIDSASIIIAFDTTINKPIAVLFIRDLEQLNQNQRYFKQTNEVMFYIRKSFRKQNLANTLFDIAKQYHVFNGNKIVYSYGTNNSIHFYENLKPKHSDLQFILKVY